LTAAVAAAALSGAIELPGDSRRTTLVAAALLVPGVLLLDLAGLLTALKRAATSEILVNVGRPLLLMAALLALWLAGTGSPSASTVIAIYLGASLVTLPLCAISCARALPPGFWHAAPAYETGTWLRVAGGFMVVGLASALYERIDLVVMGWTASAAEIAVYAVAARFGQTVVVAANAASAVMAPYLVESAADLHAGRVDKVQRLVGGTARTSFLVSLAALGAFALAGPWLLKLFGPVYAHAYVPLLIIAAGQAVAALFGPAAVVAALAGAPRIPVAAMVVGTTLNAAINLMLVPRLGATGAAIATATALACTAAVAWAATRARLGGLDTSLFAALSRRTGTTHL
jgi:O-antigen/teichoic acid export membrane protein